VLDRPLRLGQLQLQQDFTDLILEGENTTFVNIDAALGRRAAAVRAQYNLSLPDAIQIAVAQQSGCEAILTNDVHLQRVTEIRAVLVDELEL
jgi:predicted nucleic acid-binding protein